MFKLNSICQISLEGRPMCFGGGNRKGARQVERAGQGWGRSLQVPWAEGLQNTLGFHLTLLSRGYCSHSAGGQARPREGD